MRGILPLAYVLLFALVGLSAAKKEHHHKRNDLDKQSLQFSKHKHSEKHGEHHKRKSKLEEDDANHLGFKDQVRQFQMKIQSMLPRCEGINKCPKGTCCWKGKCKMLPHRINQRCSETCPCNDEKDMLFCHLKTDGPSKHKYGRCFVKGTKIGMKGVNFIPAAIDKLRDVEKKLQKFGKSQWKVKREHHKIEGKPKHEGKKHRHAGKKHKREGKKHHAGKNNKREEKKHKHAGKNNKREEKKQKHAGRNHKHKGKRHKHPRKHKHRKHGDKKHHHQREII